MAKLERDCDQLAEKMQALAEEIEAFNERKAPILPPGAARALLKGSLALIGAASKVQLRAVRSTVVSTKKHFATTVPR